MWSNLKYQIKSIKSLLNEIGLLKSASNGQLVKKIELNFLSSNTSQTTTTKQTCENKLVVVCEGISKHLKRPIFKKGVIGEDAWFVESKNDTSVLGVADGVGGWQEIGVDPSKFSSNLMKQCKRSVQQLTSEIDVNTPVKLLSTSYKALLDKKDPNLIGSSTACILVYNQKNSCLYSANLGDSGFVVIRDNKILHRSVEQQHYFNCPFQLAMLPNTDANYVMQDKPESASADSFQLVEGDIIVLATDGLWDNLNENILLSCLSELKNSNVDDLKKIARTILEIAIRLSRDPNHYSPFALAARENNIQYTGGKPDDITLLLARVTK